MKLKIIVLVVMVAASIDSLKSVQESTVHDEALYNQLVNVLKDDTIDDAERYDLFIQLFFDLENKSIHEESGTILAPIIAFTSGQLQEDLIGVALENGVTTNRLPGEFLGSCYYPHNPGIGDRLWYYIGQRYEGVKEYAAEQVLNVSEFYYNLKDRIISSEEE